MHGCSAAAQQLAHLEVVWPHEHVCDARSHDTLNPLIKILGLGLGNSVCHLGICKPYETLDLRSISHLSNWLGRHLQAPIWQAVL